MQQHTEPEGEHMIVTFSAVGDLMLGDHPVVIGHGTGTSIQKHGLDFPFAGVRDYLLTRDIVFANLEFVLSGANLIPDSLESMEMRSFPGAVACLTGTGVTVVNIANNHMLQHGEEAFRETLDVLRENNIGVVGLRATEGDFYSHPCFIERKGLRMGFLGYSYREEKYFGKEPVYAVAEEDRIISDVKAVRESAGIVAVSLHWGDEFINRPSPEQIWLGRKLIDCGVDIVLGHHPHVLQGIERYKNGVIAYSLGNFVADMWQSRMRESMIFDCALSQSGVHDTGFIPARINRSHQPEILSGAEGKQLSKRINLWSDQLSSEDFMKIEEKKKKYLREVRLNTGLYRLQCYFYFLTHIWKYKRSVILASLKRSLQRRMETLGLRFD